TIVDIAGRWARVDPDSADVVSSGTFALGIRSPDVAVARDGSAIAGATGLVDYPVWFPGDASGGPGTAEPDGVATASVASAELALSDSGSLLALAVDGAIHVAPVRAPGTLP